MFQKPPFQDQHQRENHVAVRLSVHFIICINFIFNLKKNNLQKLTILNSTFKAPTMTSSPRRTRSQKGKTLPEYVDDNDNDFDNFDFDDNIEENCMEDINSSMKNATISSLSLIHI